MDPAVRQFIQRQSMETLNPDTIHQVMTMLPTDDITLDAWFTEAVENGHALELTFLAVAAQSFKRVMDPRHLVKGARLLAQHGALSETVRRIEQDATADYLMEAIREWTLDRENQAWSLFFIATWCRDRRNGKFPDELVDLAQAVMDLPTLSDEAAFYLLGVAVVTNDEALLDRLSRFYEQFLDAAALSQKRRRIEEVSRKLLDRRVSGLQLADEPRRQPRRVVAPKELEHKVNALPKHVYRSLGFTIEKIADDEKIEFKTHACRHAPAVLECRINAEYALLFRTAPSEVHVLDVVRHRHVQRTVKALDRPGSQ